jgi:hypothetical protein
LMIHHHLINGRPALCSHRSIYRQCQYGGFRKWRYPQMMVYNGTYHLKWVIWGYPYFRKPRYHPHVPKLIVACTQTRPAKGRIVHRNDCVSGQRSWVATSSHPKTWDQKMMRQNHTWNWPKDFCLLICLW